MGPPPNPSSPLFLPLSLPALSFSHPQVANCVCDGKAAGILFEDEATGRFTHNIVCSNQNEGVAVHGRAHPTLECNVVLQVVHVCVVHVCVVHMCVVHCVWCIFLVHVCAVHVCVVHVCAVQYVRCMCVYCMCVCCMCLVHVCVFRVCVLHVGVVRVCVVRVCVVHVYMVHVCVMHVCAVHECVRACLGIRVCACVFAHTHAQAPFPRTHAYVQCSAQIFCTYTRMPCCCC